MRMTDATNQLIIARDGHTFAVDVRNAAGGHIKIVFNGSDAVLGNKAGARHPLSSSATKKLVSRIAIITNEIAALPSRSNRFGRKAPNCIETATVQPASGYPIDLWLDRRDHLLCAAIIVCPESAEILRPLSYRQVSPSRRIYDRWLINDQEVVVKSIETNAKIFRGELQHAEAGPILTECSS
jgi:hypothetical protein